MELILDGLDRKSATSETLAEIGKPVVSGDPAFLQEDGFSVSRGLSAHCLGWIWMQWLSKGSKRNFQMRIKAFVDRGLKLHGNASGLRMRPQAELFLLHCAIFGSPTGQLLELASQVVDLSVQSGRTPERKEGELYATAWCGMLKHFILGNIARAHEEYEAIWSAYRHPSFCGATKPVVAPWIAENWDGFRLAQSRDFEKMWSRGRKDGTVLSEPGDRITVTVQRYPIEEKWCWAHSGLAVLAHRKGIKVATDPFWFPPYSLECVPK